MNDVVLSVSKIENALIGSALTGNKGMVHLLDDIKNRVQDLEDKQILANDRLETFKWFQRGVIGIIFAYISWLLTIINK